MHPFRKKPSSATPTNSPPPTPKPPIVEYIKQELATFYPRTKDPRALVASSSALALTIASTSRDPADTAPNEPGSSKESVWKAAYGMARMSVEIANASSDMFLPLKAVVGALSVLINNYDRTAANADQIREIEERVRSLGGILTYPVNYQDSEEKARREVLRGKLAGIVAKLRPLSEEHGLMKFLKNVDHANILNGFVNELTYTITDYQTSLQQSIRENTKRIEETTKKIDQNIIEAADQEFLGKLNPVLNAGYQAGHHDTCLRGTREAVLNGIMQWAKDPQEKHVFWLNGLAGTGKSTIAQTFSGMIAKTGNLGASFFCSRDYLDRKELKHIFPTIAYQLACRYPDFRRHIVRVIKEDPSVASNSLISQLEDLIIGPLSSSNISCVIVIDALDECVDDQPASAILSVLGRHIKQLLPSKCFITGRPEPRIRTGFRLPLLEPFTRLFLLHEVKSTNVDEDIRLYLREKLTAVSKRRSDLDLSDPWPRCEDLTALTKKSSGLFIFASTLVRFIESEHHEPNERLQLVITPSDSTVHEGRVGVDPLYTQILVHAFSDVTDDTVFINLRRVLGAIAVAFNPLSRGEIAGILGVDTLLVTRSLRHLHSVLLVPTEDSKEIRVFHKSFPDFLQDRDRCSDPKFFIDSSAHHGDIAIECLKLLRNLKPNPCDLPDFVMNQDVTNLPELLEDKVGGAIRYACRYWAMHFRLSPTMRADYSIRLISAATMFLGGNATPWIEIMSLENRLESVIHSIYDFLDWIGRSHQTLASPMRRLAQDCLRFTMQFFHPIQQSASHIYHSALPLSPTSSIFYSRTGREKRRVTEFHGHPKAWGVVLRTITTSYKSSTCVTTFGHKIAIVCDDGTVAIYDSVTGVLRLSLSPADPTHVMKGSQDGSLLFCAHRRPSITMWDIQTGGLIHTFTLEQNVTDIAISLEDRYLACRLSDGAVKIWEVETKMERAPIGNGLQITHLCWLNPEEQLAVAVGASVHIWDVASAKVLRRFTMLDPTIRGMAYSQTRDELIILTTSRTGSAVYIIRPLEGLPSAPHGIRGSIFFFAFAQTTNQFVCCTETLGLEVFDISTQLWRHFEHPGRITFISSLPIGTVVVGVAGSGIQVLTLDGNDEHTTSQEPTIPSLTVRTFDEGKIVAVIPTRRNRVVLLETATMTQLLTFPVEETRSTPTDGTEIICASFDNHMVLGWLEGVVKGVQGCMQLRYFHDISPRWTVEIGKRPSVGGISPSGSLLVTYEIDDSPFNRLRHPQNWNSPLISLRDARNGMLKSALLAGDTVPIDITFDSDTQFYLHHDTHRVLYTISPDHKIDRRWQLSTNRRHYDMDKTCEWVVSDSKRICWVPPAYIGSVQPSYCWAGRTLIMSGQDGKLRKLTFDTQSEG